VQLLDDDRAVDRALRAIHHLVDALDVTSSKTMPGLFLGRYASPICGLAGMIIAAGKSLS